MTLTISTRTYGVRTRKDKRGANLISDVLPFCRMCYGKLDWPREVVAPRLTIAVCFALFVTAATPLFADPQIQRFGASRREFQQPILISQPSPTPTREVTKIDISAGIKQYVNRERRKSSDKKFHLRFREKDLALDLIRVHGDPLSGLGGDKYFACVDMKAADGTIYDIDFFLAGRPGSMNVTETSVHKINGKPLYNWKEQGGAWKKIRVSLK
jgi:hypothetical protein